jgi:ADP-heptose:LPS heptosyltransferase
LRYLEVVSLVGSRPVTVAPRLSLRPEDLEESFWVVPASGQRMVLIHPGVGDPMRRWPPEKFAAVGDALAELGAEVLVTAGREDEREIVDAVLSHMKCPARGIWRKLSLGGLAGLIARCDLMVGNDSGPLQMAAALGTPTVGIFWCGNLITAQPMTQAKHRQLISWTLDCPQCGRNTISDPCGHKVPYVSDVPAGDVIDAALEVFGDGGLRRVQPTFSQSEQSWAT